MKNRPDSSGLNDIDLNQGSLICLSDDDCPFSVLCLTILLMKTESVAYSHLEFKDVQPCFFIFYSIDTTIYDVDEQFQSR